MQIEGLAMRLRPRSMAEAADLGVPLVQRNAGSLARTWVPMLALVTAVAMATVEIATWLPSLIIFCAKPWLDRTLLFVLSRAVFGDATHFGDVWRARGHVCGQQWVFTWTLLRLSPWRSFTHAIGLLEGQRGRGARARRALLLKGRRGAAAAMHFVFAQVEIVFVLALVAFAVWLSPQGMRWDLFTWFTGADTVSQQLVLTALYATAILVVEPFYVAAGFAMYLNRRVELEAWDIEQEFRRAFP